MSAGLVADFAVRGVTSYGGFIVPSVCCSESRAREIFPTCHPAMGIPRPSNHPNMNAGMNAWMDQISSLDERARVETRKLPKTGTAQANAEATEREERRKARKARLLRAIDEATAKRDSLVHSTRALAELNPQLGTKSIDNAAQINTLRQDLTTSAQQITELQLDLQQKELVEQHLADECTALRTANKDLREQLLLNTTELATHKHTKTTLTAALARREQHIKEFNGKARAVVDQNKELDEQAKAATDRNKELEEQARAAADRIKEFEEQSRAVARRNKDREHLFQQRLQNEITARRTADNERSVAMARAKDDAEATLELRAAKMQLDKDVAQAHRDFLDQVKRSAQEQAEHHKIQDELIAARQELARLPQLEEDLMASSASLQQMTDQADKFQSDRDMATHQLAEMEQRAEKAESAHASVQMQLDETKERATELAARCDKAQSKVQELSEQANSSRVQEEETARNLQEALDQAKASETQHEELVQKLRDTTDRAVSSELNHELMTVKFEEMAAQADTFESQYIDAKNKLEHEAQLHSRTKMELEETTMRATSSVAAHGQTTTQLAKMEQHANALESLHQETQAKLQDATRRADMFESQHAEAKKKLGETSEQASTLHLQLADTTRKLDEMTTRATRVDSELTDTNVQLDKMTHRAAKAESVIAELAIENDRLQTTHREASTAFEDQICNLNETNSRIAPLTAQLDDALQQLAFSQCEGAKSRESLEIQRRRFARVVDNHNRKHNDMASLRHKEAVFHAALRSLYQSQLHRSRAVAAVKQFQCERLQEDLDTANQERDRMSLDLTEARSEAQSGASVNNSLVLTMAHTSHMNDRMRELRRRARTFENDVYASLRNKSTAKQLDLDRLAAEHTALQARYNSLEAKYDAVKAKHDAVKAKHDAMETKYTTVVARYKSLEAKHIAVEANYKTLQAKDNDTEARYKTLQAKDNDTEARYKTLQADKQRAEDEHDQLQRTKQEELEHAKAMENHWYQEDNATCHMYEALLGSIYHTFEFGPQTREERMAELLEDSKLPALNHARVTGIVRVLTVIKAQAKIDRTAAIQFSKAASKLADGVHVLFAQTNGHKDETAALEGRIDELEFDLDRATKALRKSLDHIDVIEASMLQARQRTDAYVEELTTGISRLVGCPVEELL
ncbi:hypothetical protein J1614_007198 [Plenodomus biglobosus]|nr:hypothetical protein J1614_007198 [Plenodomus biglobosus]